MATREENIKKINEELEKLAGGIRPSYIYDSNTEKDLNTIKDSIKVFKKL